MLTFDYRRSDMRAVVTWDAADEASAWLPMLRNALLLGRADSQMEGGFAVTLPWWQFLGMRSEMLALIGGFSLRHEVDYRISEVAAALLSEAGRRAAGYQAAVDAEMPDVQVLLDQLKESGFERALKSFQLRNIRRLASLPAGATFSVPGAGKTTEALATFAWRSKPGDSLLVVAPINAFAAWDEQLEVCFPSLGDSFVRLRKWDRIPLELQNAPRFMIISYHQLARVPDHVSAHLARHRVHVFLDESHKVKGRGNVSTEAILSFSHLPVSKLVLSGTPMPQAVSDLLPQFQFLFPEVRATDDNVIDLMRPIYVRTNKLELDLPPVRRRRVALPMDPLQARLYELMKSEVAREAAQALSQRSRSSFRRLGRSVMRILQLVSNPALLASEVAFAHSRELANALVEGRGPKVRYTISRVRQLASEGHKVIVWTSFVANVEYLAEALQDVGAVFIHGGVDAGDESDDETREGKIRAFHNDPSIMVMVANPAAASEGISLHTVCHHAIYLDRTFNAAQYLQSEDRIHRIGLEADQDTYIEIVECVASIDETVRQRLEYKIDAMARALSDPGLTISSLPLDPEVDEGVTGLGELDEGDVRALLAALGGKN